MDIPGYTLLEKIGEGGMATVWKARQTSLDRTVAIKILQPHLAADPDEVRMFLQEARIAARIKHPHVVQIYDVGEVGGVYFFAMEYINGPTLAGILAERGHLSVKDALTVARSIAEALEFGWTNGGLVHRDIKPDNIMLDEGNVVKLADLGLARSHSGTDEYNNDYIEGTPNFMSPEQAEGNSDLDFRSDMYSLGATIYHALTGRLPFEDKNPIKVLRRHIKSTLPNPRDLVPSVSPGAARLVARLMMKDPAHRYDDWSKAIVQIKRVSLGRPIIASEAYANPSTIAPETVNVDKLKTRKVRRSLPAWVRRPAWCLLFAWFAALAYVQVHPLPPTDDAETNLFKRYAAHLTGLIKGRDSELATETRDIEDYLRTGMTAGAGIEQLKTKAASYLLAERFRAAKRLALAYRATVTNDDELSELDSISTSVHGISTMPALLRATFLEMVDKETTLFYEDAFRSVRVRAVSGDRVSALITDGTTGSNGSGKIVFNIADIDPAELARLLGTPHTPVENAMHYLLYMQAGDYESAGVNAANSGTLSNAFTTLLESRLENH